jgi:hypothetical protein
MIKHTPLDYAFDAAGIRRVSDRDFVGEGEPEWSNLLIFGEYDCAEGGGAHPYITVHEDTGCVFLLDVERNEAIALMNSSVEQFVSTFVLLDRYLGCGLALPNDIEVDARQIDPMAFDLSKEWRELIRYLIQSQRDSSEKGH